MNGEFDDEILMAYADGELAADAAARVEAAIAVDPALSRRVSLFAKARRAVADDAAAHPPAVPEAIVARVRELAAGRAAAELIRLPPPERHRSAAPPWRLSIAAAVALAVGLGTGLYLAEGPMPSPGLAIAAVADPALRAALADVPAGGRTTLADGSEVAPIASFRTEDGRFCREFTFGRAGAPVVVAVACHVAQEWSVGFAMTGGVPDSTGYAPASSLETLDAFIAAIGAGPPLSPEEEATALAAL